MNLPLQMDAVCRDRFRRSSVSTQWPIAPAVESKLRSHLLPRVVLQRGILPHGSRTVPCALLQARVLPAIPPLSRSEFDDLSV